MMNVLEVQQELVARLAAVCLGEQRVPDQIWIAAALDDEELAGLLRAVYPYADNFDELPPAQRELLLERVRLTLGGSTRKPARRTREPRRVTVS